MKKKKKKKRDEEKATASFYDSFGFLTPYIVQGKMLMQKGGGRSRMG